MSNGTDIFFTLVDLALAEVKDCTLKENIKKVGDAQRECLIARADARRDKNTALIKSIQKLDIEKMKLEHTFSRVRGALSDEAIKAVENMLKGLDDRRSRLVREKRNDR